MDTAKNRRPPPLAFETAYSLLSGRFAFKIVSPASFKQLPSYDDRNFYFEGQLESSEPRDRVGTEPFVLKISNPMRGLEFLNATNAMMLHLRAKGIKCSEPVMSKFGRYIEKVSEKELLVGQSEGGEVIYPVRVMKFVPGEMMNGVEVKYLTPRLLYNVGQFVGQVNTALEDFYDPAVDSFVNECWDLQHFTCLKKYIPLLTDEGKKEKARKIMELYEAHILPAIPSMNRGVIHGDMNMYNIILCRIGEKYEISGLIDFGDSVRSYYLFELAILLSNATLDSDNPVEFVVPFIRGYLDAFSLSPEERDCLYYAVLAHLCTSGVKGEYNVSLAPDNKYIQIYVPKSWRVLTILLATPKADVDSFWRFS